MAEALRLFFLAFYAIGVLVLILRVLPLAVRSAPAERRAEGLNLCLPFFLLPVGFLIPPAAMLTRIGEVNAGWSAPRLVGLLLGLYAAMILPWSAATLGRFLVPQARVSRDHQLGKLCTGGRAEADGWLSHESALGDTGVGRRRRAPARPAVPVPPRASGLTGRTSPVAAAAGGAPGRDWPARTG